MIIDAADLRARKVRSLRAIRKRTEPEDPAIIGAEEAKPIRCPGCKRKIPWALIRGW